MSAASNGNANPNAFTVKWIPPILAYCTASICMTLVNKLVLSGFKYKLPFLMLGVQSLASVVLLEVFTVIGWTKHRSLNWFDVKRWMPVALLMAAMLYTGSKSLQFLSVPVFTIFKNLSIIMVAYGESKAFGGHVTPMMLLSFALMVLSSIIAAQSTNTASMSAEKRAETTAGYIWMLINCIVSAAFVIFMRLTIRKSAPNVVPFKDFDTVFYNNALTAPMFFLMSLLGADGQLSEFMDYYSEPEHISERNSFINALLFSGISAYWISYASSWCVRVTNSTTYSMVGSLNKLPIAISGLIFFKDTEITIGSVGSIMLGFGAGVIYTLAKLQYDEQQKKKEFLPVATKDVIEMERVDRQSGLLSGTDEKVTLADSSKTA